MIDPSARGPYVELTRAWLASGAREDEVLGRLRQRGLGKIDCIAVLHAATGMSLNDAKRAVHYSPAWADRREQDDALGVSLLRAGFIECVLGGGTVDEPPELVAEWRDRQNRGGTQLRAAAAGLPEEALAGFHEAMADNELGAAFVALVTVGQQRDLPDLYWDLLASAAEALCLYELMDLLGAGERPGDDAWADVEAARFVRARVARTRGSGPPESG